MHKVQALYPQPEDPEHFKRYYTEMHLPLARQMPGLRASRHSFAVQGVGGPAPYFCIWEGEFDSEAALGAVLERRGSIFSSLPRRERGSDERFSMKGDASANGPAGRRGRKRPVPFMSSVSRRMS